jgi:hypothetical protein
MLLPRGACHGPYFPYSGAVVNRPACTCLSHESSANSTPCTHHLVKPSLGYAVIKTRDLYWKVTLQASIHHTLCATRYIPLSPRPGNRQVGRAAIGAASPVQITRGRWLVVGWLVGWLPGAVSVLSCVYGGGRMRRETWRRGRRGPISGFHLFVRLILCGLWTVG